MENEKGKTDECTDKCVANLEDVQKPIETFINGHANNLIKSLTKFSTNKTLCDVTIVSGVDKVKFTAHRVILSALSDYFLTMFTGSYQENVQTEITLANITGDILQQLMDYCYSGKIIINRENSQALIEAATEYQFPDIVRACTEYLMNLLDSENCIRLYQFSELYDLKALRDKALQTLYNNFPRASKTDEFKQMSFKKLKDILEKDDLNVTSEMDIIDAIELWINDDANRKLHLQELLDVVRLQLLDSWTIEGLIKDYKGTDFENSLHKALKWRTKRQKLMCNSSYRLMVVDGDGRSLIEYYCPNRKKWKYWKRSQEYVGEFHAANLLNNVLYALCCYSSLNFYKLNVMTMTWQTALNGPTFKKFSTVAVVEGTQPEVYVLEGDTKRILWYNQNNWNEVGQTPTQQSQPTATVVGTCIYIYECCETFSKMQIFNTFDNTWSNTSITNHCHQNVRIATLKHFIYIVESTELGSSTVQRFNTMTDTWLRLSDFPHKDCQRLYSFNRRLYACTKSDVYTYDDNNDVWTKIGSFNEKRSNPHLFCINMEDYSDFIEDFM